MDKLTQEDLETALNHDAACKLQSAIRKAEELEASYAKDSASACAEAALIFIRSALTSIRSGTKFGEETKKKKIDREEVEWFLEMASRALKLAGAADSLGDRPMVRAEYDGLVR